MTGQPSILLLAGPTAAGKTALSLHAARELGAEIINADSMQVYDRLAILSARPSQAEMGEIPHHLFGVIDPARGCSVGTWSRLALSAIEDIRSRGKQAVLVGGTGLYFKALTEGLAPAPEIPESVRGAVAADIQTYGLQALREEALRHDYEGASRLVPYDRQRLQRIVEVGRATGQALSALHTETSPLIAPGSWRGIVIQPPRDALYERIEARFGMMMAAGALEEARAIAALDLAPDCPAMKAVGLPPLLAHLRGEIPREEAVEIAKRDSRRYAKRQYTWFANQHPGWARITGLDPASQRAELEAILRDQPG